MLAERAQQIPGLKIQNDVLNSTITARDNTITALQQQILVLQIVCGILGALLLFAIILIIILVIYFAVIPKVKGSNVSYFMFRHNNNYDFFV